ncbi:MAG: hypothetical protein KAY24_20120 [Candidatus Eisenbacteria sp.]|nr:hypothetical protein [Candidatus Eisenbacteria bacterium]
MTVTKLALQKLLYNYLLKLEPVQKDIPVDAKVTQKTDSKGRVTVDVKTTDGDVYMPKQWALSIAKSVARALQPQLAQESEFDPWFKWNATDLSQFGAKVDGSKVSSSSWTTLDLGGVKWVCGAVTSDGTTGHNGANTCSALPILLPPTQNNLIMADFIMWSNGGSVVGSMVFPRFTSTSDAVWVGFGINGAASPHEHGKFHGAEAVTVLGTSQTDPATLIVRKNGIRLGLGAEKDMVLTGLQGERQLIVDTSGDVTEAGAPAIGMRVGNTANSMNVCYFRNIRCYTIPATGVCGL